MSQSIEAQVEICGNFFFPKFLTSEYFEDILQKYNNDVSLKVESVDVGQCTGLRFTRDKTTMKSSSEETTS
jgi:hypothetical protein